MSKAKQHHDLPNHEIDLLHIDLEPLPEIDLEPLPEINFDDGQTLRKTELTTAEAVEYIKPLSRPTLHRHCKPIHHGSGQLPNIYSVHDLDQLLQRFTVRSRGRWAGPLSKDEAKR